MFGALPRTGDAAEAVDCSEKIAMRTNARKRRIHSPHKRRYGVAVLDSELALPCEVFDDYCSSKVMIIFNHHYI